MLTIEVQHGKSPFIPKQSISFIMQDVYFCLDLEISFACLHPLPLYFTKVSYLHKVLARAFHKFFGINGA